ncbi:hypothetical protein DUI87_04205 [Hirundo rustica rustica]|uniref:Maestro/Maestro-like HEAT-repeats domain-containing protein n=1 Tax=Hirundo rustica rustica TaxID=333673 RepID=A0A3M0KYE2_HIRRU|nr:hypothetical protein DUI87_04205 [Hirundo rustica rustica]
MGKEHLQGMRLLCAHSHSKCQGPLKAKRPGEHEQVSLEESMTLSKAQRPRYSWNFTEAKVPDFVRNMHQRLVFNPSPEDRLFMDILRLTEAHPTDVAVTLLRCAPSCDRFAVQTVRALFHHLRCLDLLVGMERKHGWDTLLCADTHHYAVGLLAREMRHTLNPLCSCIALRLLGLLSTRQPRWDLPALAFLVEAEGIRSLTQSLMGLLQDADGEVAVLILSVFLNEIQDRATLISSPTALQLAEALQPLFDHNSYVQLLSIRLFREVMELVIDKGKKALKTHVRQSLLPLFFHCHDQNQRVAEASLETLLCATKFLKRRHLKQLVKKQPWRFGEHLLQENRSRAAELLSQALPYLESPQEPLREAAVRFIGIAGQYLNRQREQLQLIYNGAFQAQLQDLPTRRFSKPTFLQVAINPVTDMEQRPPRVPKLAWMDEVEEEGPGAAQAEETEEVQPFQPLQEGWKSVITDVEQRPPRVPKLAWVDEEEGGPGVAAETEEVQQFQPLQEDAALDQTQEQDPTRGLFRTTAQLVCKFIKRIREEETSAMGTGVRGYSPIFKTKTSAALLDMLVEEGFSSPKQVPAMVRYIHHWLMANEGSEHKLFRTLLDLTDAQPDDVVMTLLRVAPLCDRTAERVQLKLVDVLENWPEHSTCTSDGDKTGVFALAATVVMWKILQVPCVPHMVSVYFARLFVHLLSQVFFSTLDIPEEVDTFWKACQKQHGLATSPNSFAVQTLKSLLCEMHCEHVVVSMERKCGWDTLLCADTHHYAVGLLAREMSSVSTPLCSRIARYLLRLLSTRQTRWDLPALAFLVETEKMWSLTESLVELLEDPDGEIVQTTVMLLSFIVLDKALLIPSPFALQLAEALLPLFDHCKSQVRLLSILLFQKSVTVSVEKEKKALKTHVRQSLLPLFFHCHDEDQDVAEASWATLLCAAMFLKRRDLEKLVKKKKLWMFSECLLQENSSRVAELLHQALPYLESPQEPLREAAIRFIGICGRSLRRQREQLQLIYKALEDMADDVSPAICRLALQTSYILWAIDRSRYSMFENLQNELRRISQFLSNIYGRNWQMDCVHPKGSKCSSGSDPTQPIPSQITRGKA